MKLRPKNKNKKWLLTDWKDKLMIYSREIKSCKMNSSISMTRWGTSNSKIKNKFLRKSNSKSNKILNNQGTLLVSSKLNSSQREFLRIKMISRIRNRSKIKIKVLLSLKISIKICTRKMMIQMKIKGMKISKMCITNKISKSTQPNHLLIFSRKWNKWMLNNKNSKILSNNIKHSKNKHNNNLNYKFNKTPISLNNRSSRICRQLFQTRTKTS